MHLAFSCALQKWMVVSLICIAECWSFTNSYLCDVFHVQSTTLWVLNIWIFLLYFSLTTTFIWMKCVSPPIIIVNAFYNFTNICLLFCFHFKLKGTFKGFTCTTLCYAREDYTEEIKIFGCLCYCSLEVIFSLTLLIHLLWCLAGMGSVRKRCHHMGDWERKKAVRVWPVVI